MIHSKINWTTILLISALNISVSAAHAADTPSYNRAQWKHWTDHDKNCKNTREEALTRDAIFVLWTNDKCNPVFGVWHDTYTGEYFFQSGKLDADHIVPLKNAHDSGGWRWTKEQKSAFANDMENVIMVYSSANRSKGSKAPHKWMPNENACQYIQQWTHVKLKYDLDFSIEEKQFLKNYTSTHCKR